jgi:hypothetical protein
MGLRKKSPALIAEMIPTALKIARDEMTAADLKLINRLLKRRALLQRFSRHSSTCERWPSVD